MNEFTLQQHKVSILGHLGIKAINYYFFGVHPVSTHVERVCESVCKI